MNTEKKLGEKKLKYKAKKGLASYQVKARKALPLNGKIIYPNFNKPQEITKNSKSRVKKILSSNKFQRKIVNKTKADTSDFENEGLGTYNVKQGYNLNLDSAYYGTKISERFYKNYSKKRKRSVQQSSQRNQKLKFKNDKVINSKKQQNGKQSQKKRNQKLYDSIKTQTFKAKNQAVILAKKAFTKVLVGIQSLFSTKSLLIAIAIALIMVLLALGFFIINGLMMKTAENSYVFSAHEATRIDRIFTEMEVDYAINLQKKIEQANTDTIINFESVGHEPHELLALVNVMILPEYIENDGRISRSRIDEAMNTIFEARYQFEEKKETYTVETESGETIEKTRYYLTSNTESFDNIVSGSSGDIPANTKEFLYLIGDDAREIADKNGLYASVMLAQAILETGSGSSDLSSPPYYNLFGIKGAYEGETVYMKTAEDDGTGNQYTITDGFRDYPSYRESMEDYAYVLKNQPSPGFYAPAWKENTNSYREATAYLQGTYATDTQYASKLNRIIEEYDLVQYDGPYLASNASKVNENTEEKLSEETSVRTVKDIKEGNALSFTSYEQELYKRQKETRGLMGTYPSPFEDEWSSKLISQYGFNWNKENNLKEESDDIQLNAELGSKIASQLPGKVTRIYKSGNKLGVEVKSKDTLTFQYENLETVYVRENASLNRGDIIGTTSSNPLSLKAIDNKGRSLNPQIMMATASPNAIMHSFTNSDHYSDPSRLDKKMSVKTFDDQAVQKLFDTAKKYMGMPYVFGGKTPQSSFDCSGLIVWVYTESGFKAMGLESAQGIHDKYTVPISKEEARPGDLVFFERTYNAPTRITHVGIYAGDDIMFHAGDPIGFARIDNAYWSSKSPQFARVVE